MCIRDRLYGSRAANGVILITTKKGQIGKPVVTLKAEVGFTPCWATEDVYKRQSFTTTSVLSDFTFDVIEPAPICDL